ncbi:MULTISPECIES: xanthine dehydrogenase family protein molybdopterin-binding subunit [Arsenicicoccus]|uniref:xanthine dehydrogenase family protein molybdopterin-binding subunit n=1 Tax=Arsenicicoccus TaxID=267408 RepID=UPI00257C9B2F|nr:MULTISPECIES: xanthine dehydrogenase family protein molybdopterin-binding subunit [Arsenicicoccus]
MTEHPATMPPLTARAMGTDVQRRDAVDKVRGRAPYAFEQTGEGLLYAHLVTSTVARGTITSVDDAAALAAPGVHAVVHHANAPRLDSHEDRELDVLQDGDVDFHGQIVAIVLADSPEAARHGASLVEVSYQEREFVVELRDDSPVYRPESVNAGFPTDSTTGDVDAAMAAAAVRVEEVYRTPHEHNNPMEPHAFAATWSKDGASLEIHDSTQHPHGVQEQLATAFGLEPEAVHVLAPHIGGGFGSKGLPHAPDVAAALSARTVPGRTVKLAVTRQQMFSLCGYRSATVSRVRLGADEQGRLVATEHAVHVQTSRVKEFVEQAAVPARSLYAAPHRSTSHRVTALDVAIPSWMRAPGVFPGVVALEMAMDELACRTGIDPIELRRLNEPDVDPDTGLPFSERRLVECLELGAERFGWSERPSTPGSRVEGDWRIGLGVASATYPGESMPGNVARVTATDGRLVVAIAAADLGTGARTTIGLIAADALGVAPEDVDVEVGDTSLPQATVAGGSSGTSSWGSAVVACCRAFREQHGDDPAEGASATSTPTEADDKEYAHHSFGAQFAEVAVNRWTGEIRVRRLLGVFSAGRIVNPRGARSQLIGGMTMGLGAALHEESVRDPRFGHVVTQDLATYHVPANADAVDIEALWLPGADDTINPMGARGIGEIGITGVSAAIVNAAYNATGVRVRSLPITADAFL